jgi:hypothetical protein
LNAVAHHRITPQFIADQVALGHARPSLMYQVEHGIEESLLLPRRARRLDRSFEAARRQVPRKLAGRWRPMLGAVARQVGRWTRGLKGAAAPR